MKSFEQIIASTFCTFHTNEALSKNLVLFFMHFMLFLKTLTRINLFHVLSITERTENSENSTQADQSAFSDGRKILSRDEEAGKLNSRQNSIAT